MALINEEAFAASCRLAKEKGVYRNWKGSIHDEKNIPIRNAARTAIAPTGTIGIIADTTPGIEPLTAFGHRSGSHVKGDTSTEVNPLLIRYAAGYGLDWDRVRAEMEEKGTLADIQNVSEHVKRIFKTALEIPFERHLQIQAAFQRHVDNSVSKTVNLPAETTKGPVRQIFLRAWELGLKGVTVFRSGSKSERTMEQAGLQNRIDDDATVGSCCDLSNR